MVRSRAMEVRMVKMAKSGEGYFWIGGPGEEAFNVPLGMLIQKGKGPQFDYCHFHYRNSATLLAMADVPVADAGLAAGIANVSMQVSAALGLAVLGTVATDHSRALFAAGVPTAGALTGGYQLAFDIAAALVAAALLVAVLALRPSRSRVPVEAVEDGSALELGEAA